MIKAIYIFDHCNIQNSKNYFFTIVVGNASIEVLSLLLSIFQGYSFVILRRAEHIKFNNDMESTFQLNNISNKIKLSSSTLCLLISTNPRYEGYYLNLNLRQRILKKNFKCLTIGSLVNLTFPISFLRSNFICQNLKLSTNPILIYNNELFKRNDSKDIIETLKILCYTHIFSTTWNGLNMLNSALSDIGMLSLKQISGLTLKDLNNFSSLYFLNLTVNNILNLKKITKLKLLNLSLTDNKQSLINKLFLDQNNKKIDNNVMFLNKIFQNY